ncbi:hypothetical protein K502DRAFT_303495 [Neoconidiobolus thromboides FSU 785]|nr:hypothetical protein K502DRAFT_303495 [Neoconidiobolus thromboides FSU 785]
MSWKGFKKAVDRLPHNLKSKVGLSKGGISQDEDFELYDSRLRGMEEDFDLFLGQLNQYRSCANAFLNHQYEISVLLSSLYEAIGDNDKANIQSEFKRAILLYLETSTSIKVTVSDLLYQLDDRVIKPTTEVVSNLRSIRKLILKRAHKLVDLNRHSEVVTKLNSKVNRDVSDEKKLYKYEQLTQIADQEYSQINEILLNDLPKLFDLKNEFLYPIFIISFQIQHQVSSIYFESMSQLNKLNQLDWNTSPIQGFELKKQNYEHLFTKIDFLSNSIGRKASSNFMDRLKAKSEESNSRLSINNEKDNNLSGHRNRFGSISTTTSSNNNSNNSLLVPKSLSHQRSVSNPINLQPPPAYNLSAPTSPILRKAPPPPAPKLPKARALYDYKAQEVGDLEFMEGDIIDVIKKTNSNEDWWTGKLKSKIGVFPANYVELI